MEPLTLQPLSGPVTATVSVPGSKSYTNRALLLAAMTEGPVSIRGALQSDDTRAMLSCLSTIGIAISELANEIIVENSMHDLASEEVELNANLSGTTIRFLLALCCVIPGTQTLTGEPGLLERPIKDLVDALTTLGASIEYTDREGYPPVRVTSKNLSSHQTQLSGAVSSQFLSALMMIAPVAGGLEIAIESELVSRSYALMTRSVMADFGVDAVEELPGGGFSIKSSQSYSCTQYTVEGDYSSAGYFFAIAALTSSTITVANLKADSAQADASFLDILKEVGCEVDIQAAAVTVRGHGVRALPEVDMEQCPDQAQTMAVLAAFADGATTLSGVRTLRVKETERVQALEAELAKTGIKTTSTHDTLTIHGGNPHAASIATYGDHRMAMAFAVAGMQLPGIEIENPEVVNKTFPTFWETLEELRA